MNSCSICINTRTAVYINPNCGHCYCNSCLSRIHIPDLDYIQCLLYGCQQSIEVNQLEQHFMSLYVSVCRTEENKCQYSQEFPNESVIIHKECINNSQFRIKQVFLQPHQPSGVMELEDISDIDEHEQQQELQFNPNELPLNMYLLSEDTVEYCGKCYFKLNNNTQMCKSIMNCQVHYNCYGCLLNSDYETITCNICNKLISNLP